MAVAPGHHRLQLATCHHSSESIEATCIGAVSRWCTAKRVLMAVSIWGRIWCGVWTHTCGSEGLRGSYPPEAIDESSSAKLPTPIQAPRSPTRT